MWNLTRPDFELGQRRKSDADAGMSAFYAEAVISGLKTDIGFLKSAIGGKAAFDLARRHVRF